MNIGEMALLRNDNNKQVSPISGGVMAIRINIWRLWRHGEHASPARLEPVEGVATVAATGEAHGTSGTRRLG
jgi:hypothetical protein